MTTSHFLFWSIRASAWKWRVSCNMWAWTLSFMFLCPRPNAVRSLIPSKWPVSFWTLSVYILLVHHTKSISTSVILYLRKFVPKVYILMFYLNVYYARLKLQVFSFKVRPLRIYTVVPMFYPLIAAVPEVIVCWMFLAHRSHKIMTI
jgi:hypothetical protein